MELHFGEMMVGDKKAGGKLVRGRSHRHYDLDHRLHRIRKAIGIIEKAYDIDNDSGKFLGKEE